MKNLTKKLFTVLVAVLLVVTGFTSHAFAENPTTDTATVTVSGLEPGAKVKLYQVVQPKIVNGAFNGYEFVNEAKTKLIGPNDLVEVQNGSDSLFVAAKDLDADGDGKIDEKYTKDSVEYTVDTDKKDDIIYDMERPTPSSINLAVAAGAYKDISTEKPVEDGTDYVQFDVKTGQYFGIVTPGTDDNYSYNPVVLSAGYKDAQIYKVADPNADPAETPTHFKKVDGNFDTAEPIKEKAHLYENCVWDDAANKAKFKNDDPNLGVTAGDVYARKYIAVGQTTENQLIAQNLSVEEMYKNWPTGSTAIPKRSKPGIVKNHETVHKDYSSDNNPIYVALVAVDKNNCELVTANDELRYIKKGYSQTIINDALEGKKFKLENGVYIQDDSGSVTAEEALNGMLTKDAKEAETVRRENGKYEFTASQGEEIRYTLAPSVPQYPLNAKNKTFVVTDNLSDGIDFVEGSIEISFASNVDATTANNGSPNDSFEVTTVQYDVERVQDGTDKSLYHYYVYEPSGKIDASGNVVGGEGTYYKDSADGQYKTITGQTLAENTVVYTLKEFAKAKEIPANDPNNNNNDLQVNFIYDNLPGEEGKKVAPIIKYKAVLLETAIEGVAGNPNVAKVYYAKNSGEGNDWNEDDFKEPSGDDYNEWRDAKKVYTYEIRFRKTNDKPEYITTEESPTHYLLKKYDENWTAKQKAAWNELVKKDGVVLYETTGTAPNLQNNAKVEALVKLANGAEEMRHITSTDPITDETNDGYNADIYELTSKTLKLNPDFTTLSGAIFGLYPSDQDAKDETNLITQIQVGNDGVGFSTKVANGTYYLKELKAPEKYSKNTEVYPITAEWTSATEYTTETSERKVYTVDITEALNQNDNSALPKVKTNGTNNVVADASVDATTKLAEDQVGWLVGTGTNDKFYECKVYDLTDATGNWTYDEENHKMTNKKDGTVIENVFRAYLKEYTKTTNSGSTTIYNNNGGTVSLNRINNTETSELPSTGGIGTYVFTVAGVAILATAAFMLIFRRKEENV